MLYLYCNSKAFASLIYINVILDPEMNFWTHPGEELDCANLLEKLQCYVQTGRGGSIWGEWFTCCPSAKARSGVNETPAVWWMRVEWGEYRNLNESSRVNLRMPHLTWIWSKVGEAVLQFCPIALFAQDDKSELFHQFMVRWPIRRKSSVVSGRELEEWSEKWICPLTSWPLLLYKDTEDPDSDQLWLCSEQGCMRCF